MRSKDIINSFNQPRKVLDTRGSAGFDNIRENIDPHVKTKSLSSIEANIRRINEVRHTKNFTSIQAAIDDLPAAGGTVFIDAGTYTITSTITINKSNVSLIGEGKASIIFLAAGSDCDMIEVNGTDVMNVTLSDFYLDGNKANQTGGITVNGIFMNTDDNTIDPCHIVKNIYITSIKGNGLKIDVNTNEHWIDKVRAYSCDVNGFDIHGSDHKISNCVASACTQHGFFFDDDSGWHNVIQCKSFGNGFLEGDYGNFSVTGQYPILFTNCEAQNAKTYGWYIYNDGAASPATISLINCNSQSNAVSEIAGKKDGVLIADRHNVQIIGGNFSEYGTGKQQYGIHITGDSTNCLVLGVEMHGNLSGQYLDASSGSNLIFGCIGNDQAVSGTFTTADAKTITVTDGIITTIA